MTSVVAVANMALGRIGVTNRITALSDQRQEARDANFWYPIILDQLLQSAPWGFARKAVALTAVELEDNEFPGWSFAYQYPSDCLQPVAVCPSGGIRNPPWMGWWDWGNTSYQPSTVYSAPKAPYQIASKNDASIILTDIEEAYLYYIFRNEQVTTYPPLFIDALAWWLAPELGSSSASNAQKIEAARGRKNIVWQTAVAQMLNAERQDQKSDSPSIQVRG